MGITSFFRCNTSVEDCDFPTNSPSLQTFFHFTGTSTLYCTKSPLSFMTSNVFSSLNPVTRETVILAFQLSDFLETDHSFTRLFSENTRRLVFQVIENKLRPPQISRGISTAREDRARARSQSVEAQTWPTSWAIDKSSLRSSLKLFEQNTRSLQRLEDPPSTGTTPHVSPTDTPSHSRTEHRLENPLPEETSRSDTEEPCS